MPWRSQKWEQNLLFFTEDVQGQSLQTQMLKNAIIIHSKEKNSQNYNVHAIYGNVLRSGWPNSDQYVAVISKVDSQFSVNSRKTVWH